MPRVSALIRTGSPLRGQARATTLQSFGTGDMSDYWTLPSLQDVYLEDSWVRQISVEPHVLRLQLEVVLRESHPFYVAPPPGSQYCYRNGTLLFHVVRRVDWRMGRPTPTPGVKSRYLTSPGRSTSGLWM
jgi:hypothetical protein